RRLIGTTDAVQDARKRAEHDSAPASPAGGDRSSALPGGWGKPDVSDEGDVIVISLQAPGLRADTVSVEPRGSSLQVRAEGGRGTGAWRRDCSRGGSERSPRDGRAFAGGHPPQRGTRARQTVAPRSISACAARGENEWPVRSCTRWTFVSTGNTLRPNPKLAIAAAV